MVSAILGSIIMAGATTALMLAVQFAEGAFNSASKYPITFYERKILQNAGLLNATNLTKLQADIDGLPRK